MSVAGQVIISGAIGGTAEALGGGKFANGAVTGAYVMMFNHLGGEIRQSRLERRIQRRFQQNAMNDPGLSDFSIYEYLNGEIVMTESGNEYILWDNRWLDLPEWQTQEISYDPVWDGGEGGVGVRHVISREAYIKQEYLKANLRFVRWRFTVFDISLNPLEFTTNLLTGGFRNMIEAERLMYLRMDTHDNVVRYYRK